MDVAKSIKDKERSGISRVVIIEDGNNTGSREEEHFWELLGGTGPISSSKEVDDGSAEKAVWERIKLYKVLHQVLLQYCFIYSSYSNPLL